MVLRRLVFASVVIGWLMALGPVCAQGYPSKLIRIVTVEPGGGTDFAARLFANAISGGIGQQVIVENRGGASGILAVQTVVKAPPDGHTVLLNSGSTWLLPFLQEHVPYDPVKDLAPITFAIRQPNVLTVHPSLPVKNVRQLIALAKARPGALTYAAGSVGSSTHLSPQLFRTMADINILHISYKGTAGALNNLLAGHVQLMFATAAAVAPHIKTGRLRALAVTSAQTSEVFPGLPTISASGLPGYESVASYGFFAPARTPDAVISRLNQEILRALENSDVKAKFLAAGIEPVGSSPAEFAATIKSDMAKWGKIIKDAGIRSE